ncbi:hypothetical protein EDB80DRAFT_895685 [Ilyonectria destructans]|nr:hypothetical protein EDB80DRAFT_895685 [Ilyonectria destructans]
MDNSHDEHSRPILSVYGDIPADTPSEPRVTATSTPSIPPERDEERGVNHMLQTPWDRVYTVSLDGKTYKTPVALRSSPVDKIDETGLYWESSWQSLDKFLKQESTEEDLKKDFYERRRRNPTDKSLAITYKVHQDNVSKHRKIREIFGAGSPYHPNQLVSKHHLPPDGLCHKETMYKLACKVSDLRVLHERGELSMDPWDFLRWRIGRKAQSLVGTTWESTRGVIKTVITRICDDSGEKQAEKYEDRLLRKAVLRSAQYQNKLGTYGSKNTTKPVASIRKTTHRRQSSSTRAPRSASPPEPVNRPFPTLTVAARERQERRQRLIQPSGYQGVNAFRAQQRTRSRESQSNTTEEQ